MRFTSNYCNFGITLSNKNFFHKIPKLYFVLYHRPCAVKYRNTVPLKWKYKVQGTFTYQFLNHCDRNGSYCLRYQIKNLMKNYLKTVCYYICVFFQSWPYQMSCQYSQHGLPMQLAFRKYHENVTDRTLNRWTPPLNTSPVIYTSDQTM